MISKMIQSMNSVSRTANYIFPLMFSIEHCKWYAVLYFDNAVCEVFSFYMQRGPRLRIDLDDWLSSNFFIIMLSRSARFILLFITFSFYRLWNSLCYLYCIGCDSHWITWETVPPSSENTIPLLTFSGVLVFII